MVTIISGHWEPNWVVIIHYYCWYFISSTELRRPYEANITAMHCKDKRRCRVMMVTSTLHQSEKNRQYSMSSQSTKWNKNTFYNRLGWKARSASGNVLMHYNMHCITVVISCRAVSYDDAMIIGASDRSEANMLCTVEVWWGIRYTVFVY